LTSFVYSIKLEVDANESEYFMAYEPRYAQAVLLLLPMKLLTGFLNSVI